ncbi:cbb3-type cytochrome c oxidase subunit I [Verrucomicrobiales bacterium BCK34]|nr:cbb3-type cytochrome c oxidase subunit I [Verrucomicrobiales bacterium BCK34]
MTSEHPTPEEMSERAAIDRSARFPVLFFFTSAAAWLLVATLLGFFSSLKLSVPGLWDNCQFLGYGRLFPAHMNALVYGWAMQAGLGVVLWLMARLSRNKIEHPVAIIVAGALWNAGVTLSVITVWFGFGNSMPLLDFPAWVWPVLAISYALIVVWIVPMFRQRGESLIYVSEMFVLGAVVWFPWIFITANLLINKGSAPVMAAGTNAWFITNLSYFWMAPIALAIAYYIVPKISGRAVFSYPLAQVSFWLLAGLAGWTGFARYMGGPFPAWMSAVSSTASIFILLAVLVTVVNILMTLKGATKIWEFSPSLRFTVFGMLMLAAYALLSAVSSTYYFGKNLQFSHFVVGLDTLAFYGFFSMTVFGAIYFIVPRITGSEWPSGKRIRTHFWFSAYGIITLVVCMLVGGIAQGGSLAQWDQAFSTSFVTSSAYVAGRCIAWALISFSNLMFLYQLALMFIGKGRKSSGPTLIHAEPGKVESAKAAAGIN